MYKFIELALHLFVTFLKTVQKFVRGEMSDVRINASVRDLLSL